MVEFLYPRNVPTGRDISSVLDERVGPAVVPFDESTIAFLDRLSRSLFQISRSEPAIAPLAFFLRRANTSLIADRARRRVPEGAYAVPQGTVFHVPPTNVDTLFLYTLAISMLAGNANVVRISPNAGPGTERVLNLLLEQLDSDPVLASRLTIVRFGRDAAALEACSSRADVRMVWGGDGAIHAIRQSPLSAAAKELTFPDRISLAAVAAAGWLDSSVEERDAAIEGLYNDVYWFDQMACSSPAQIVLVGNEDAVREARHDIAARLDRAAERRYGAVDGQSINKMVALVSGLDNGLGHFDWISNNLVVVDADDLASAVQFRPGGGFLSAQRLTSLTELVPQLTRRVQTLSVFGFSRSELVEVVRVANGRGIDRIVPVGSALDFDAVWDGKDLLLESLRFVTVA